MKKEDLLKVSSEQFMELIPCGVKENYTDLQLEQISERHTTWSALDILDTSEIKTKDKLYIVLQDAFLPEMIQREYAFRCTKLLFSFNKKQDKRIKKALRTGNRWLLGRTTNYKLDIANSVAHEVVRDITKQAICDGILESMDVQFQLDVAWATIYVTSRMSASDIASGVVKIVSAHASEKKAVEVLYNLIDERMN